MDAREAEGQGARDAATVLPFVTAILLTPPVILIFAAPVLIGGVPLIVAYVFGVWAAVILMALLAARRLAKTRDPSAEGVAPDSRGRG